VVDEYHRLPHVADVLERVDDLVDVLRCQPLDRFVEQEEIRVADQAAADRDHLLLAAREVLFNLRDLRETLGYGGFYRLMLRPKMLRIGWEELTKSYRKEGFVDAAQRLVPGVGVSDFRRSYAGVRAQLVTDGGELVKEQLFEHTDRSTHVLNAVSPGLTCSLPFGETLSEDILENLPA